tara:strand:- start:1462 stop:1725 length:264 start_codon:yes stop_codon:yes gene_type:complete
MKQPFNKNGSVLTDNAENSTKLLGEYAQYLQMLAEWCLCYMDKHQKLNLTQHDFVRLEVDKEKGTDVQTIINELNKMTMELEKNNYE